MKKDAYQKFFKAGIATALIASAVVVAPPIEANANKDIETEDPDKLGFIALFCKCAKLFLQSQRWNNNRRCRMIFRRTGGNDVWNCFGYGKADFS